MTFIAPLLSKKQAQRVRSLMPGGIPRHIRCYRSRNLDSMPYTIVLSKAHCFALRGYSWFISVTEGGGVSHGEHQGQIDWPSYAHLGRRVHFLDLPEAVRRAVVSEYVECWALPPILEVYPFSLAEVLPYRMIPERITGRS